MGARAGQAMVETVIAVLIVTSVFLALFKLSHLLTGKILLEHASLRVARARAVGLNDFMCKKVARVAVIPVAGRRLWPEGGEFDWAMELARVPVYLQSADASVARGVLEYDGWDRLRLVRSKPSSDVELGLGLSLFDGESVMELGGRAGVEENSSLYLLDAGR